MEISNALRKGDALVAPDTRMLTYKEASDYLHVHPKTIYRYTKLGMLHPHKRAGMGRPLFSLQELDSLMQEK